MRSLDLYALAVKSLEVLTPQTRIALEGYAAGVNARLDEINTGTLGRGAPELFLFKAPIVVWQPADSIVILKLLATQFSDHMASETLRAKVSLVLEDQSRLDDIFPSSPGQPLTDLPAYKALFDVPTQFDPLNPIGKPHQELAFAALKRRGLAGASNAWAATIDRAASNGTLLANDPHFTFSAPTLWYLARLELTSGGIIGGTIPGIPAMFVGRGASLGWGLTSSYLDDLDLYIEQLNPNDPQQYLTPEGFRAFRTRKTIIYIKDAAPITINLRWTQNGPVIPSNFQNLKNITPKGHVVTVRMTALSGNDTTMNAALSMMQAQSTKQAIDSAENYIAPSWNLILADSEDIALKTIGAMPRRDPRHQSQGRLPSPGWIKENQWAGRLPYSDNPVFTNPKNGLLGNTNNQLIDQRFPNHMSFDWGDSQRIKRWQKLMTIRKVHTRDSFIEAQLDTVSFTARSLLPLIGTELWFASEAAPNGTVERRRKKALDLMANWNGEMNEHIPEPLLFSAWMRALQSRLIQDEMGSLAKHFRHVEPLFIERVYRDLDGAAIWCDIKQSARLESCAEMSQLALDDALLWVEENWGHSFEALRWGDAHQATHDHPALAKNSLLQYFVNIRQSTSGGDNTLMRGRSSGTGKNPFESVHGAGYRGVYDFADSESSVFITSTGQSGHFLSPHYDDLGQLWRRGEYVPMTLDLNLARAGSVGITHLIPKINQSGTAQQ
jgi:penicillin G amidase